MLVRQDLLSIGETQLTMTNVYPRFFHWEHSGQHFAPSRCPIAWGLVQSSARLRQIVFSSADEPISSIAVARDCLHRRFALLSQNLAQQK
jgi:hypothetical protein